MIAVSDLSVRHLRDISLTVPEGAMTLVLGANGSGKSTLMSAVAGLITPQKGSVTTASRPNLLMQESEYALFGQTPLEELLLTYPNPDERRMNRAREVLCRYGIDPESPVATLSFGQKRKLALLTTLFPPSDVLLFDEPTAGLDWFSVKELIATLKDFRIGRSVLIATHDVRSFLSLLKDGDSFLFLYEGKAHIYPRLDEARKAVSLHPEYGIFPF